MKDSDQGEMLIITTVENYGTDGRIERGLGSSLTRKIISGVSIADLKENMQSFLLQIQNMLETQTAKRGEFQVSQVEISAQISGEGKICLLGSNVGVGTEGGIKFILKRRDT